MSKVGEYFSKSVDGDEPCCVPMMEVGKCACGGPTDAELAEIENTLDTTSWEDIEWD